VALTDGTAGGLLTYSGAPAVAVWPMNSLCGSKGANRFDAATWTTTGML